MKQFEFLITNSKWILNMDQPERLPFVPLWARKTAAVTFLKIFQLNFVSEYRGNGEYKHFIDVSLFGKYDLVSIMVRTGATKEGMNSHLPRIYRPKKFFSPYHKDLTDKYDTYSCVTDDYAKTKETKFFIKDSEFETKFEYTNPQ